MQLSMFSIICQIFIHVLASNKSCDKGTVTITQILQEEIMWEHVLLPLPL
jgi:hypothetical protein